MDLLIKSKQRFIWEIKDVEAELEQLTMDED